jgi:hypothetical protein
MATKIKCDCGKEIEGLSESQAAYLLSQHKLSKKHKNFQPKATVGVETGFIRNITEEPR